MAAVHAFVNQKGGAGKTTLVVNCAAVIAEVIGPMPELEVSPVLVVSTDPQGSATWWADRVGAESLPFDFVQAIDPDPKKRMPLKELQQFLRHMSELPGRAAILVDTPGNLEDGAILDEVLETTDKVIVPMPCAGLAWEPTRTTLEKVILPKGKNYAVVLNDWDPRDGTGPRDAAASFVDACKFNRANSVIRHYRVHVDAAVKGLVCTQYPGDNTSLKARMDFLQLTLELGMTAARPTTVSR